MLKDWEGFLARPNQLPPEGEWDIWAVYSGRGGGKTRMGAEYVKKCAAERRYMRMAFVGEKDDDVRDIMVEGDSGILGVYDDDDPMKPEYKPSKKKLKWPNGVEAKCFHARDPDGDNVRGYQMEFAWCDELAKWEYPRATWDQIQFCMRDGDDPRILVTSTPRPIELVRAIERGKEGIVKMVVFHTKENAANLAPRFLAKLEAKYGGTRLGRQELEGEILGDVPNALWTVGILDACHQDMSQGVPPDLGRIVVAIDPAASSEEESALNGISVVGASQDKEKGYVLADESMQGRPVEWARRALALYNEYGADAIVAEINNGGQMVEEVIRSVHPTVPVITVTATRGKHVRAEPISALYEQGRIKHAKQFNDLEDELLMFTSDGWAGERSPDRADAMVWGFTELFKDLIAYREGGPERRKSRKGGRKVI